MTHQEKAKLTRRILSGQFIFDIELDGKIITLKYQDPTIDILSYADFLYDKSWQENRGQIPTLEEYHNIMVEKGEWDELMEYDLNDCDKKVAQLQEQFKAFEFQEDKKDFIKKQIGNIEAQKRELLIRKNIYYEHSLEHFCYLAQRRYLISSCISILEGEILLTHKHLDKIGVFVDKEDRKITEEKVREIARTAPFRNLWKVSCNSSNNLISRPLYEMSVLQQQLMFWAMTYDAAFESIDAPSDEVVSDDDAFDLWMKDQGAKRRSTTATKQIQSKTAKHKEVYLMADAKGAKKIYEMNDPAARQTIKSRQKVIKDQGVVREVNMPDVRQEIKMEYNRQFFNKRKGGA